MQSRQFKVRPDGFREVKKKFLIRLIAVLTAAIAIGIAIGFLNTTHNTEDDFIVLPVTIGFMAVVFGFSIYRSLNRGKALFESFKLTIEPDSIFRDQLNTPDIHIYHSEVTQISRLKNGCLLIKSGEASNMIAVPPQIEGMEELEAVLSRIRPIDESPKLTLIQKYPIPVVFLTLGTLLLVFASTNKLTLAIAGPLLAGFLIWLFKQGRESKNIDQRTRKSLWWTLFLAGAVMLRVILILLGY